MVSVGPFQGCLGNVFSAPVPEETTGAGPRARQLGPGLRAARLAGRVVRKGAGGLDERLRAERARRGVSRLAAPRLIMEAVAP